jgi:hypothetical protein
MSIGFSQTFRLDLDLLAGTIDQYVRGPDLTPDAISQALGIGRRKLDGLNGWLKQMRLRDPRSRQLTDLAKLIYAADISLDSRGTHILLHYLLCSNPDAKVWYGLFNEFISQNETFTRDDVKVFFEDCGVTSSRLKEDIGNLLNMYTAWNVRALADLHLLEKRDGRYLLQPMQDIPPMIFAFCLYDHRERHAPEATTSVERLLVEPERPGKVFGMREPELRSTLKAVEWAGLITIVRSADIDGISYTYHEKAIDLLRQHYGLD